MEKLDNSNSSAQSTTRPLSTTTHHTPSRSRKFFDHWSWHFDTYLFVALFGVFALSCLVVLIRQWTQPSNSRGIYVRFTTFQLFIAATMKVVALLWSPKVLDDAPNEIFAASLIVDCLSTALMLSALSILLLILLETTKTSLAAPKLQNIWALLGITALLTAIMLTFNLLVLLKNRKFWRFFSHIHLFIWGLLICVGYTVAGRRMWRNLKSSRQLGRSARERRLQKIIQLVLLASLITAASLILNLCIAANNYGILKGLEIAEKTIRSRYAIKFLRKLCDFAIMVLIFGIAIEKKSRNCPLKEEPALQLGTFTVDRTKAHDEV